MPKDLEKTFVKIVLGFFGVIGVYLVVVGLYSLFTWTSFFYNMGYSIGYISGTVSSWF